MTSRSKTRRARLGTAFVALAIGLGTVAASAPAAAQSSRSYRPSQRSAAVGRRRSDDPPAAQCCGRVDLEPRRLPTSTSRTPSQINLFGKEFGEATVIATAADGSVVYGANVRVSQNLRSINEVLRAAMPESEHPRHDRRSDRDPAAAPSPLRKMPPWPMNLALRELNPGVDLSKEGAMCKICVINRLKTATPLQVNLKVRIAEVNRSLLKQVGVNLLSSDPTSGFQFGIGQGDDMRPARSGLRSPFRRRTRS